MIQHLSLLNKVLCANGVRGMPLKKVISGKSGEEESRWWSSDGRVGYEVGLWKSIRKEWNTFLIHLSFVVDIERVKSWTNIWYEVELLCVLYPSLHEP